MAKKKRSKKLQKKQRAHARAALKRAQRTARRAQAAKERAASAPSSAHPRTSNPLPALAYTVPYENASRVFGRAMEPQELVDRIACYDWRASMGKLAYLSSILGNGDGDRAQQMMIGGIRALRASTPGSASLVAHAKRFVNASSGPLLIAHEEALLFLQHVIVLHAPDIDGGPPPGDGEVALWLLAASDHLDQWAEEDTRPLTKSEELLAEQIKVFRYNRRGDPMRTALRTYRTFLDPPRTGTLSVPSTWEAIQREAFHGSYREYFERFALPVFMLSNGWGTGRSKGDFPRFLPADIESSGPVGPEIARRLRSMAASRGALQAEIRRRMRPDGLLPHAPTALLHHPLVDIGQYGILAVSPWALRAMMHSGIWAQFLRASKVILGEPPGGDEWLRAFGLLFEEWLRLVAGMAALTATRSRILLPSIPGAVDEIEDVVVAEGNTAVFFSGKGRMVKESVAWQALSRSATVDTYDDYLFEQRADKDGEDFRGGAIRILSKRIDLLRAGEFEPRLDRNTRVYPVLVTYDPLCADILLYKRIEERCVSLGLMQQPNLGAPAIATAEDFERLMSHAARGRSVVGVLRQRDGSWRNRRLDVQLHHLGITQRMPAIEQAFNDMVNTMSTQLFGRDIR